MNIHVGGAVFRALTLRSSGPLPTLTFCRTLNSTLNLIRHKNHKEGAVEPPVLGAVKR